MSSLIVIRIVPQTPVDPTTFSSYLNPPGLGALQIAAFDLSFGNPATGVNVGSASFITPSTAPTPVVATPVPPPVSFASPQYTPVPSSAIVQQYDLMPSSPGESAFYQLESVATAVIQIPSASAFENLRLVAQYGSGAGAAAIPIALDFYDVAVTAGPAPNLNTWTPSLVSSLPQPDPFGALKPSLYLQLPSPPTAANPLTLQLPTDGTPPPFDALLDAVTKVLKSDPGAAVTPATTALALAGSTTLQFASTNGITAGMSASGAGIPDGTVVSAVGATVTLSQELSANVPAATVIKFTPDIGNLSSEQCRNIAYEIVWSQQPPVPAPPDSIESLYTNPPNNGILLSGSTPNSLEGDRQQFEGKLTSYYAVADTNADRLTNFVYTLSAAVACEQLTVAAAQAILEFPVNPGVASSAPMSGTKVILTGIGAANPAINFGVPAAYFYALAAMMPVQITPQQRYQMATGDNLVRLLTDLTSAIHTGTVSDAEQFVTLSPASINAAQAARRMIALGVALGSATPLAPLDTVELLTTAAAASGSTLSFASTSGVAVGMLVSGENIAPKTTVSSFTTTSVTLSAPILDGILAGNNIVFTSAFAPGMAALIQGWLSYPPASSGEPSSAIYQPTDDATKFWPGAAAAQPAAFLNLVLSALTQGYIIPPPFDVALGDKITDYLKTLPPNPPTPDVTNLAAVTVEQWTSFFQQNPTWLPPFTQPGNTAARIAAFIRYAQMIFDVESGGPPSSLDLATTAPTSLGNNILQFAPTTAVVVGMSVSGPPSIPAGVTVGTVTSTATVTSVTISQAVTALVPTGTNVTFAPSISAGAASPSPLLQGLSTDWLAQCLTLYGPFSFGSGFNLANLRTAAAGVFPNDPAAQAWLVDALVTIDALYQVMKPVALPPPATPALEFSVIEALYARGFKSAADITELSSTDFKQAVIGSVAYGTPTNDLASAIYASAAALAIPAPVTPPGGGFQPVNPDGSLTNCIPPPCFSPLGPIAYLNELLQVSADSTCEKPLTSSLTLSTSADSPAGSVSLPFGSTAGIVTGMFATGVNVPANTTVTAVSSASVTLSQPVSGDIPSGSVISFAASVSLGSAIAARRGPLGNLAATCANCETPLPLIDIVNECLEYMGSVSSPANGTVYDTSPDRLDEFDLCHEEPCPDKDEKPFCHDPAQLFAALPEYSTPGIPVAANSAVEPSVYQKLKADFSSCCLPYSQALDVSRTYLRHFRSCRFEEMRTFRKCITEFVLDPVNQPAGFQSHLWRYPVRIDIAIEYLGITPEEYAMLFQGTAPQPCAAPDDTNKRQAASASLAVWQLYGFASPGDNDPWTGVVVQLPEFLERTCLTYCEFFELWKSGYVAFRNGDDQKNGVFPECEPCCLDKLWLQFPDAEGALNQGLLKLAIFIRLWRKLRESCCFCYSFAQLRDIADVLVLFNDGVINPDFIRQLAAFQMFRDHFHMELADPSEKPAAAAIGADRTQLLSLWVGRSAAKWNWALNELLGQVDRYAQRNHKCERRSAEFIKLLSSNLDPLSRLAGFDPASPTDTWHALPTHTLRFAEVLAKIYASDFSVGEILYIFTSADALDGDDPFPLQEENEALDWPLGLPDDEPEFSLRQLRHKLLEAHVAGEEVHEWHWPRVEAVLQNDFGFALNDILALGRHFFPAILDRAGHPVDTASTRYVSSLPLANTSAPMWNAPPDGPFYYDPAAQQLWTRLPMTDAAVIEKLAHVRSLNADEQKAVQDLYFQPRAMLAAFAMIFEDFAAAEKHLIQERDENQRWGYFRRQLVACHRRCCVIAEHLSRHVAAASGQEHPESDLPAFLVLRNLFADENMATAPWENDAGTTPPVTWTPPPNGGAFAALLGLTGTGLVAEYKQGGAVVWRDVFGPLAGFGKERDEANAPVPTVLPSMSATLTPQQMKFVSVHNGFLTKDANGERLGGAQGFEVKWSGALLVDREGAYEFWAGAPSPEDHKPDWEGAKHRKWHVTLKKGQRTWILSSHHWPGEEEHRSSSLPMKPGVYELTVELVQSTPEFPSDEPIHRRHTGLQVKYSGPDTDGQRVELPHSRLFSILKDQTLSQGVQGVQTLGPAAASFLGQCYTSSLRDIRRTYQRAFKALLFVHRFALSARTAHGVSELGYMLAQKANFAGAAYYRSGGGFVRHAADFDFNLLPLRDDYHPPAQDSRTNPSPQRMQAMFDWWERLFDYTRMREEVHHRCDRQVWHLFEEAEEKQPAQPAYLLRHMGADSRHWHLDLRCYQGQSVPVYAVTSVDLEDDRWTVRAWHADEWLRAFECHFTVDDIAAARPDLWASDDPSLLVAAETDTGNANLSRVLWDGCLENRDPRRYKEVQQLNNGLRERGRKALLCYLCHMDQVPLPWAPGHFAQTPRDLSDLLLLDVEAGICEKATRIQEAITAVQNFIRRARLRLEPGWTIHREFARFWDREFSSFHVWQACKRRHLYKENWIEWSDLEKARKVEAFRFLESKLRTSELTIAAPGGLEWWPDERPAEHPSLDLLQKREPSEMQILPAPREGLNLLGTPERDARPSWLAAVDSNGGSNQEFAGRAVNPVPASDTQLPFWMETAIRMGTRFYRIAAAGVPPAAMGFEPHHRDHQKDCVSCCAECGCSHPALVDEYYFWLIDGRFYNPPVTPIPSGFTPPPPGNYQDGYQLDFYDPNQQESALWQDPTQLPNLLDWRPSPMVLLAWCRVHNREFQQPRRSHLGVEVQPGTVNDLTFLGRTADSLTFSVGNAVPPEGYLDTSAPGFRYDLAPDYAVVLPQVTAPAAPPVFLTLPAYPYFVFDGPGAPLFPLTLFSPSLTIGRTLRAHCRFEAALQWYRLAFDPLQQDCTWVRCGGELSPNPPPRENVPGTPAGVANVASLARISNPGTTVGSACCDSTDVSCDQARNRSIILHYLETLVEWAEAAMRRGNSPEAFEQARVILDAAKRILGKTPSNIRAHQPNTSQTVSTFKPEIAPLNPRLLDLYEIVKDRLDLIHAFLNSRRLRNGRTDCEMPYFGNDPLRKGWESAIEPCAEETEWCHLHSPYRFMILIQKAQEFAAKAQELGAALLAAFEKGDAEYLASLRAGHERELLTLSLEIKKDQWRDADWQIEALQKTKAVSQANLVYTNALINAGPGGLIDGELQYQQLTSSAISLRGAANITEAIGEAMRLIPDIVLGAAGFGGTPVSITWIPLGTKLGEALEAIARITNNVAEINSMNAGLNETDASWERRLDEWTHQAQTLAIEIQQMERQILGAERRRDQALQDLDSHRRQMEQSAEVQNFLRDKFTAHNLYLYLQKETAALFYKTWDLALHAARQAQHAFNLERGHTTRRFLPECTWDNLHEGLLAGERLSVALRHMEKAYMDENVREYELIKHFSLRLHFPMEFLRLRTTGYCEIELPEWMFDLDFPGHYMRRTKNMIVNIPCVTGPHTGVHCRMTLIDSMTRIDPRLRAPAHDCCCQPEPCCGECGEDERQAREYEPCPDDPRIVRHYGAREAIATSTGQNDSGMFELRFDDQRYVPFEYMGAVCRLRIELPPENNYFDMSTLSDTIIRLNYTAREGGSLLRRAAHQAAQRRLPGDGWCFFDVRHEFPDAWQLFRDSLKHEKSPSRLKLRLDRKMFPFVPGGRELSINKMSILFGGAESESCHCPEIVGCPCPSHGDPACRVIEFARHDDRDKDRDCQLVHCVATEKWPDLYCGIFETRVGPLGKHGHRHEVEFRFPHGVCDVDRVFLLLRYTLKGCPDDLTGEPCLPGHFARAEESLARR